MHQVHRKGNTGNAAERIEASNKALLASETKEAARLKRNENAKKRYLLYGMG